LGLRSTMNFWLHETQSNLEVFRLDDLVIKRSENQIPCEFQMTFNSLTQSSTNSSRKVVKNDDKFHSCRAAVRWKVKQYRNKRAYWNSGHITSLTQWPDRNCWPGDLWPSSSSASYNTTTLKRKTHLEVESDDVLRRVRVDCREYARVFLLQLLQTQAHNEHTSINTTLSFHFCAIIFSLLLQWRAFNGVLLCRWYVATEHDRWPSSKLSGYRC